MDSAEPARIMLGRLPDIVDKLYKPPIDGRRQVFAVSRTALPKVPQLTSIALISITSPGKTAAKVTFPYPSLQLIFADVDFLSSNLSVRAEKKLPHAFTKADAALVTAFVDQLPPEIRSIVVQCDGGFSRSAAIAKALCETYGYHGDASHFIQANSSIYKVMVQKLVD